MQFEQVLVAAHDKTAAVRPLTSHIKKDELDAEHSRSKDELIKMMF